MMVKRLMAVLGLLAFAVATLGGAISDNSLEFTLSRALWAMAGFCVVGALVGWAAQHVVREHHHRQYEEVFGHAPEAPSKAQPEAAAQAEEEQKVVESVAVEVS